VAKPKSPLQQEIVQRKPFRSPAEEAALSVVRTASLMRRAMNQAVSPYGITQPQYNVLRILRGAGAGGLPTLAVRDRLIDEAPGITRLVNKLEYAGLLKRERSTPDRRQVMCYITKDGLALLKRVDPLIEAAADSGPEALSEREQKALIALLEKVRGKLSQSDRR
jgi:DNA-binding MarR family transcriptional regulator